MNWAVWVMLFTSAKLQIESLGDQPTNIGHNAICIDVNYFQKRKHVMRSFEVFEIM